MFRTILLTFLLVFLSACSAHNESTSEAPAAPMQEEAQAEAQADMQVADEGAPVESKTPVERKVILTGNFELETTTFEQTTQELETLVEEHGGYFESITTSVYNDEERTLHATIKIPSDQYQETKVEITMLGQLIYVSETEEDVTATYYDSQNRLETKKTEETRLLAMIEQATTVDELLALEQRLGEVRVEIEQLTAIINNIDHLTSYSTIYLNLLEKTSLTTISEPHFLNKIKEGFSLSIDITRNITEGIILFLTAVLIPGLIILMLFVICYSILKKIRLRKTNK